MKTINRQLIHSWACDTLMGADITNDYQNIDIVLRIQALYTDRWNDVNPSISEGRLYSHNGTISEYMVSSVLPAYSAETAEPPQ